MWDIVDRSEAFVEDVFREEEAHFSAQRLVLAGSGERILVPRALAVLPEGSARRVVEGYVPSTTLPRKVAWRFVATEGQHGRVVITSRASTSVPFRAFLVETRPKTGEARPLASGMLTPGRPFEVPIPSDGVFARTHVVVALSDDLPASIFAFARADGRRAEVSNPSP
jgi:hypothetical protein